MSIADILKVLDEHEKTRTRTINLVASENVLSPAAQYALISDIGHRYSIPPAGERPPAIWDYPNQSAPRAIQKITEDLACRTLGAAVADVRPLSGNNAAYILFQSLLREGDHVASVAARHGGHFTTKVICERERLCRHELPYREENGLLDVAATEELCSNFPVKLIFLDASMISRAYPLAELRARLPDDVVIAYDASHTMGLIMGGQFQSPFSEGADIVQGSTHKSLFGPQKALFAFRERGRISDLVRETITPLFVSNSHPHHTAALAVALQETHDFGREYAAQVVSNARCLAMSFTTVGYEVGYGCPPFTDSHQFVLKLGAQDVASTLWRRLELAGLHANLVRVPFSDGSYGLRIGSAEVTRRGFRQDDMRELAALTVRVLASASDDDAHVVRPIVHRLSMNFPRLAYGYNIDGRPLD